MGHLRVGLGYNVTFDISNSPKEFFAPYFKIESASDAKLIIKEVFREMPLQELDGFFERVLRTKNIDLTKELFLCIYKPDRL